MRGRLLLKFGAHTHVGPARGPEPGLTDAGEGALGVDAAGVLTGVGADPWLCTLVDVWKHTRRRDVSTERSAGVCVCGCMFIIQT